MNDTQTRRFRIKGMHCEGCAAKIRDAVGRLDGVSGIEVDHSSGRAVVTVDGDRAAEDAFSDRVINAIGGAGDYTASVDESAGQSGDKSESKSDGDAVGGSHATVETERESLAPLFLIVGYIVGVVVLVALASGDWSAESLMRHFMAGFFLVFSFFKLLDIRGFVSAYRDYDLLARRLPAWAWAYPFVELALGAAYLIDLAPLATNLVTFAVMSLGAVGVLKALRDRRRIRCACLGTVLNLPMTTVSLVEDLLMAAMAAVMVVMLLT